MALREFPPWALRKTNRANHRTFIIISVGTIKTRRCKLVPRSQQTLFPLGGNIHIHFIRIYVRPAIPLYALWHVSRSPSYNREVGYPPPTLSSDPRGITHMRHSPIYRKLHSSWSVQSRAEALSHKASVVAQGRRRRMIGPTRCVGVLWPSWCSASPHAVRTGEHVIFFVQLQRTNITLSEPVKMSSSSFRYNERTSKGRGQYIWDIDTIGKPQVACNAARERQWGADGQTLNPEPNGYC